MAIFKCKMCGGTIEFNKGDSVGVCDSCGTKQTLPRLDDDRKANLYDRANHFRRNNEFDKAMGIYEQILNEDNTDAETYWSLVLCRYGIEYVEDPASHKRIPTVNRAQFTSIFDDEDYKSALHYADGYQKDIYEQEAAAINEIQKGILAISSQEEPFDVFICYKESDNSGRRTPDSVLATELYHELVREGYKVFFSRITLEDKLGTAYEPYIFAALNSAKVMVVLGTKPEYFNAVWVKNEWSRYLAMIKNGARKMLIPAYKDMDPYDLPEEFSHLQAQDMTKLGFMQDLIRGIKKITKSEESKTAAKETVVVNANTNTAPLLKRAFMFLEDGDWNSANDYFEKVLDTDPECAEAYLGKLMAELKVKKKEQLADCEEPFNQSNNYQKAVRFGDQQLKKALEDCTANIIERNENDRLEKIYNKAVQDLSLAKSKEDFLAVHKQFNEILSYKDSAELAQQCLEKKQKAEEKELLDNKAKIYFEAKENIQKAEEYKNIGRYNEAIRLLSPIRDYQDSEYLISVCQSKLEEHAAKEKRLHKIYKRACLIAFPIIVLILILVIILCTVIIPNKKYNQAMEYLSKGDIMTATRLFQSVSTRKDVWDLIAQQDTIIAGFSCTIGVKTNNTVIATKYIGDKEHYCGQCDVSSWKDVIAISGGVGRTVGLKSDGTVITTVGDSIYSEAENVSGWKNIVAISSSLEHTVGLKSDGTVVAVGWNVNGQCEVSNWKDIVAISTGDSHTVGLKSDGTVVATKYTGDSKYYYGQCDVSDWADIVAISADDFHTVGLKSDSTVVATKYLGDNEYYNGECDVSSWKDIVAISAGFRHTVGLKSDGTVVSTQYKGNIQYYGQCDVSNWKDIVAISAGSEHTVGLKSDGTVVTTKYLGKSEYYYGQNNTSSFTDILLPNSVEN